MYMDKDRRIEEFAHTIFNYFKNDYLLIKDFMKKETPWDEMICLMLKKNSDELFQLKTDLVTKMIFTYQYNIIYPMQFSRNDKDNSSIPDRIFYNEVLNIRKFLEKENIYCEDNFIEALLDYVNSTDFAYIQIIKHYMHILSSKGYELIENNYNAFKYDVYNINEIYSTLEFATGLVYINDDNYKNNISVCKEVFDEFYSRLYREAKKYIESSFRTNYEKNSFIKYLISLAYAYMKNEKELSEEDVLILDIIENDENITNSIYDYKDFLCLILEMVHNAWLEHGEYCDCRSEVEDSRNVISNLDVTFNKDNKKTYKVDSIYTELYLEDVLATFINDNMSIDEIYCYLMRDNLSIYDRLFNSKLDPRFELDYKKDLIRKIVADNYEYHCYLTNYLNEDIENNHYKKLSEIDVTKFENILNYFIENYQSLIENYYTYQNESIYVSEKARLQIYKSDEIDKLVKINKYSINRFWLIFSNNIVELSSVDYMNKCMSAIGNDYKDYDYEDIVKMISSMCLNIYEKIILGQIEGNAMQYIKKYIENTDDIVEHLLDNERIRKSLEEIFLKINEYNVSYSEEVSARKKIGNNYQKILKRLNPFEE